MKNILKSIFLVAFFAVLIGSCNDDFLNLKPLDRMSENDVWSDPALTELFVNEMYRGLGHGLNEAEVGSMCDESHFIHNYGTKQVVESNINPSDIGQWGSGNQIEFRWDELYKNIRYTNMFFENIEDVPFLDEEWRERLKGEVHFLRSYFYHNLVRNHGGVPIITKTFGLEDDFGVKRNTLDECIKFIVDEANLAAGLLPLEHNDANIGRPTKGAALALKSRILLYAASDLFNDPSWAGAYSNPELISVSGDRNSKWQAAKAAAKEVMDLGIYQLHNDGSNPKDNYTNLFTVKESPEHIFSRNFLKTRSWSDGAITGLYNGPNGYHNWAGNTPVQELVDDYEMIDGTPFDWNNPAHAAAPYEDRDPRFSASILYDGAPWRPRPSDMTASDPVGIISIRSVEQADGTWAPGLDTRDGPIETWNGGYSGYYLRKSIDPTLDSQYGPYGQNQEVPWHFFRLGEIYLNYAEACLGLGEEAEAKTYINMIRSRAGMPDVTETGQALIDRYRNERRVELAFEQHRYWDVRRWFTAPAELGRNAHGIVINEYLDGSVTYETLSIQDRAWKDKMYLLPILQEEVNRNPNLIQNPLY